MPVCLFKLEDASLLWIMSIAGKLGDLNNF